MMMMMKTMMILFVEDDDFDVFVYTVLHVDEDF